mmetsp:Transcript_86566/g.242473  ORF Transcript_86566/g.242473 Transcript_86566/m.242473 type:complete len:623 (+) Transcript_86566:38-1906(+)|eukprot:CAMPEP_0117501858 /NCGR_PEP_ID=MMETSP0784-20121206/23517_1 /TAXON_ID=39447 /ORGANISM="" /LENGTH=622 /DNA_ID=CAMNT_0005297129 /DNA_START=27 /DNA_END=1895 /DNA_ORIENTATION=-
MAASPGATWSCAICTLRNEASSVECDACGSARPAVAAATAPSLGPGPPLGGASAALEWQCAQCTLINAAGASSCNACGAPPPESKPVETAAPSVPARPPAAAPGGDGGGASAVVRGKRTFPGKDAEDLLARPAHGAAKKHRGEDAPVAAEGTELRLSEGEVTALMGMIFGDRPEAADVERWLGAGFRFSTYSGTEWGLWQQQGGPCGVFAPVQAFILKYLLFSEAEGDSPSATDAVERMKHPLAGTGAGAHDQEDARPAVLAYALASVLFHATPASSYVLCQVAPGADGHDATAAALAAAAVAGAGPGLAITGQRVSRIANVQRLFEDGASTWLAGPRGVLSFVASVLLSRGLERVREDADDPSTPMIGRFGHCSQELVNLMLIGEATSNVFDGTRWLGDDPSTGMLVKGIDGDRIGVPPVGYLSELEPMRYISVGTLYKHPDFPLWVLGSPSHYTLLFSTRRSDSQLSEGAMLDQRAKKVFVDSSIDEGGIAMSANLGKMLEALGIGADQLSRAESELVREDVVLWMDFLSWVRQAKGIPSTPAASVGRLELFLYDGQDPPGPTLRSVVVEQTDVDPSFAAAGDEDAFAATLHTRWPNAVVTVTAIAGAAVEGPTVHEGAS